MIFSGYTILDDKVASQFIAANCYQSINQSIFNAMALGEVALSFRDRGSCTKHMTIIKIQEETIE